MNTASIPRLVRLRIGPAEQAVAWLLEAHGLEPRDYHVAEWIPLALAIWDGEMELEAYSELRARGVVR